LARGLAVVVLDLAGGDFRERDRQVVLRARLDHRRRELVEGALAEVVVAGVDLPRALGRDDDARVVGVDVLEQAVDAGRDQGGPFRESLASVILARPRPGPDPYDGAAPRSSSLRTIASSASTA